MYGIRNQCAGIRVTTTRPRIRPGTANKPITESPPCHVARNFWLYLKQLYKFAQIHNTMSDIPKSPVVSKIAECFELDLGGVMVLWGPPSSCKTTVLREFECEAGKTRKVTYLDCQNCKDQSFRAWFYHCIGFNPDHPFNKFGSFLTRGPEDSNPIIIIDHLEDSISLWDTKNVIVGLARSGRESNNFRLLVCLSDLDAAKTVLSWNSGQKIRLVLFAEVIP